MDSLAPLASVAAPSVSAGYLLAGLTTMLVITFTLRALPFAILKPLRSSRFVTALALWMPAGILSLLAISIFYDTVAESVGDWWKVALASAITVVVHLASGRRSLISIAAGTAVYVVLVNYF